MKINYDSNWFHLLTYLNETNTLYFKRGKILEIVNEKSSIFIQLIRSEANVR